MDEIGELPLAMQSKLLRHPRAQRAPLGATQEEAVDVRILSATHRDLAAEVQAGRFRQDLYYRLNVVELVIPPARAPRRPVRALAGYTGIALPTRPVCPRHNSRPRHCSSWPSCPLAGNVRELENLLHRAMTLSDG